MRFWKVSTVAFFGRRLRFAVVAIVAAAAACHIVYLHIHLGFSL